MERGFDVLSGGKFGSVKPGAGLLGSPSKGTSRLEEGTSWFCLFRRQRKESGLMRKARQRDRDGPSWPSHLPMLHLLFQGRAVSSDNSGLCNGFFFPCTFNENRRLLCLCCQPLPWLFSTAQSFNVEKQGGGKQG